MLDLKNILPRMEALFGRKNNPISLDDRYKILQLFFQCCGIGANNPKFLENLAKIDAIIKKYDKSPVVNNKQQREETMNDQITKTNYRVQTTTNYELFKVLDGNRGVVKSRADKIMRSIQAHGYIHNPIIVNEKMEVIDGQGRLKALKALNLPVEFIVFEGMTITHCIALNVSQTTWTLRDYILSYADRGDTNYKFLSLLVDKYKAVGIYTVICACTGIVSDGRTSKIRTGDFVCTGEQYEKADELLEYVMRFYHTIKMHNKGPENYIYHAIMFAYQVPGVDRDRLVKKFVENYSLDRIKIFSNTVEALKTLTQVYAYRSSEKIWFEVEYDSFKRAKVLWYTKQHSDDN